MTRALPREITAYDLLKTFAILTMIVDHLGVYFFPDILDFRAVGRLSFPAWLFLIGYARSRDITPHLIGGAVLIVAVNVVVGGTLLPLNILFTIIAARLLIDPVMKVAGRSAGDFWRMSLLMVLLAIPAGVVTEYGTVAILTAMLGYMVRRADNTLYKDLIFPFMIFTALFYALSQYLVFGFTTGQFMWMGAGVILVYMMLLSFRPSTFPKFTKTMPGLAVGALHLTGRRTLEIYVLHLIAFKVAAVLMGHPDYSWFDFSLLQKP